MGVNIILCEPCMFHSLYGGHVGIFCLFGHQLTQIAVQIRLQVGLGYIGTQRRTKSSILALLTEDDTAAPCIERLPHLVERYSQA